MKIGRAILAGAIGGFVMTILAWAARQSGMDLNAEMMLGTMVVSPPGGAAWLAGFAMHMMLSILIALIYAWGFEHVTHRAGVGIGLGFALVHIVIGGAVMAMIPALHPMIPEQMPAPGAFLMNMGAAFTAFFVVEHLLYGAVVGGVYGAVENPRRAGMNEARTIS